MNKQQITVIERAIHSKQALFPLNKTWLALYDEYNIGLPQANKLKLSEQDKQELIALVKQKTGIDLSCQSISDTRTLSREETLSIAIDEKLAGQAVKTHRLAIKALPGHTLKILDQAYHLPDAGHLDIALENLSHTEHRCILLIENYRCFDNLEKIRLNLGPVFNDPLVLYRGDNIYRENTVRQLLAHLALPVLVMSDLDPKGLIIAQSFPEAVGLVVPKLSEIENLFNNPDIINPKLYTKQLAHCRHVLSQSRYPLILKLWKIMKQHQAGIVQEYWLNKQYELTFLNFND
jgi:hypothetical protein